MIRLALADSALGTPSLKPGLHLGEVPNHTSRRQGEVTRELTTLLQLVDRAIREWDHKLQLRPPYRAAGASIGLAGP